jgi:hypothetical protein
MAMRRKRPECGEEEELVWWNVRYSLKFCLRRIFSGEVI